MLVFLFCAWRVLRAYDRAALLMRGARAELNLPAAVSVQDAEWVTRAQWSFFAEWSRLFETVATHQDNARPFPLPPYA